jgi:predicted nucleic acid-binding protein
MATKYSLKDIAAIRDRRVFFDANVLIYLFWPSGSMRWEHDYSSAFGSLLRQHNELIVDFLVISEIINRAHRLEYDKYLYANGLHKSDLPYKSYRNGLDGQEALADIYLIVETSILDLFTVVGKAFSKAEIQSFLEVEPMDFVDKGIVSTCKENSCVLLTNDKDYKSADIDILTSNPAILRN